MVHAFKHIWNLGGRYTYKILYDNMPVVFPSPTRIKINLEKYNPSCVPGVIFLETLLDIIKENNYPNKVLISEDEIAIISKTEYHPWYNSILGESLLLRDTVLPDPDPPSGWEILIPHQDLSGDLFLVDKMNLSAAERILKPEVRQLLDEVLKGDSDGTSFYLEMMYLVT
ncbi:hypothetical protein DAPPUDRAFT_102673 [Daphnia pulex]|uniref:Uncharacterized protein n=1 Tax=Daphnia pulex TaxID=6669 RepID=E9GH47_DAPPU|nr:hypothetical protein DAPPUDRAFT_102673 [Daphnia pulex]|eukprot:EFX81254.1 hypothetical protein DAPPUDRAFT_102673 [Daphnia pulex]